jgi:uncharacterized protein (DUF362 family)
MAVVAIAKQESYDSEEVKIKLESILSKSGIIKTIEGKRVLVKPNCTGAYKPDEGRTTHPVVVKELLELLKNLCTKVTIGESSSVGVDTHQAYLASGIYHIAKEKCVEIIDFKKSKYINVEVDGLIVDSIQVPEEILDVDFIISAAKLKTNYVSGISCSMKNLKGILMDEDKKRFHRIGLAKAVADLSKAIPNTLGVVDGIVGSELYEPINGNVLIASKDILACDVVCARIMRIKLNEVEHIRLRLDELEDIQIAGDDISDLTIQFKNYGNKKRIIENEYSVRIENNGCSSCLGALYLSLKKVSDKNPELIRNLEIIVGPTEEDPRDKLLFGNCCVRSNEENSEICFIRGCPPTTSEFIKELERTRKIKIQRSKLVV